MATMSLTKRQLDASPASPAPLEVLAGGRLKTPVILALDLGQRTGWAVRPADGRIASGVHEFRPGRFEGGGMIWLRFRAWLQELDETSGGIGVVVFEEVRRHAGTAASHAYGGYLAHLTAWAEANRIPYEGVPVGTIKRHIVGKGNADKAAVIAAVQALGFAPTDDNEADALALLHWAICHRVGDMGGTLDTYGPKFIGNFKGLQTARRRSGTTGQDQHAQTRKCLKEKDILNMTDYPAGAALSRARRT